MLYSLIALFFIGFVIYLWIKYVKYIRCGNMICITGGIKTGKSLLAVRQAYQLHRSQVFKYYVYNYFERFLPLLWLPYSLKCLIKKRLPFKPKQTEKPLLYSNIPLGCPHVLITKELLERKKRFNFGSVCYICEASLVADSMTYTDKFLNEELLLFNKLFAHETHGGFLIYDTQSIQDNHYAVKRCLCSYFYIHHSFKGLFFHWMFIREERFTEGTNAVNTYDEDVESQLRIHLVPKSTYKLYDRYAYSVLTDHHDVVADLNKPINLKANDIVSFKTFLTIAKELHEINEKT